MSVAGSGQDIAGPLRDEEVPVARKVAEQVVRSYTRKNTDDLVSEALLGIVRGMPRWTPDGTTSRKTWMSVCARGEVLHALRDRNVDHTIRVPVHVKEDGVRVKQSRRRLQQELGRMPSLEEVCVAAGLSEKKVNRADTCVRLNAKMVSFDSEDDDDGGDHWNSEHHVSRDTSLPLEDMVALRDAVQQLPWRERQVLSRVLGGQPRADIARDIGLSRVYIDTLFCKGRRRLRAWFAQADKEAHVGSAAA